MNKARRKSLVSMLFSLALCLVLSACESKPVVKESMDEDGKSAVPGDSITTTNIDTEGDNLAGMPDTADMEVEVLPGAE